jgi:uncharacterized protein
MPRFFLLVAALAAALGPGCATHADRLHGVREAYFAGDLATARAKIDEAIVDRSREAEALELERATVMLSEGKPKEAEKVFRKVRDRFDHLEQKDVGELALSMLADDQRLAYAGEDYEKVLVRFFCALSNLMADGQDAGAFALQVNAKQDEIIQKGAGPDGKNPKTAYQRVAAGAYLHAVLREATHQHYDDAARSLERVKEWQPDCQLARLDLDRVKTGRHSPKGHGALYVFALVGRGPYKEERAEIVTQASLLIADRILSATGKHTLPPTIAPVKVPVVVCPPNPVGKLTVQLGLDGPEYKTQTITDVGALAKQQAEAMLPAVIGRAVARRVVKKAAIYGVKEATGGQGGQIANVALDVAGVVWEATESADTRCWGLLPDKIQALRLELPAGRHTLRLGADVTYSNAAGTFYPASPEGIVTVDVADGRNTYMLVSYAGTRIVGRPMVSRP